MESPPNLDGWTDIDAAWESWRIHKLREDSIVDDLFKGQLRSAVTCDECDKTSVKFDEFTCLSVPIPKEKKAVSVLFIPNIARDEEPVCVTVKLTSEQNCKELLKAVAAKVEVQWNKLKLYLPIVIVSQRNTTCLAEFTTNIVNSCTCLKQCILVTTMPATSSKFTSLSGSKPH